MVGNSSNVSWSCTGLSFAGVSLVSHFLEKGDTGGVACLFTPGVLKPMGNDLLTVRPTFTVFFISRPKHEGHIFPDTLFGVDTCGKTFRTVYGEVGDARDLDLSFLLKVLLHTTQLSILANAQMYQPTKVLISVV